MPTIRPISHDARLSIVDHLDELRTRVIWCVIAFVVAFGVCYWQNHTLLDWLNKPLAAAKAIDCSDTTRYSNALERSGCFDEVLSKALAETAPALSVAGESLAQLGRVSGDASARTNAKIARDTLAAAADRLAAAAALAPKATSTGRTTPVTLGVTEPFLTTMTVSAYCALLLALPLVLYQIFAFVLPAFTPSERRLAVPAMVAAPVLFLAGVAFAYFLALPPAIRFLQNYNDSQYDILVQARDYYRFVILLLAGVGVMFQVPLAVLAIVRLQILSPAQLRKTRGYALLLFAIIAAVVTPTPDPLTMLLTMSPLVVLYEASIQLARFVQPTGPSRWSLILGDEEPEEDPIESPEAGVGGRGTGLD